MTPKQVYLGRREGGPRETISDCPDCGEYMERDFQRGDLTVAQCPACGYQSQHIWRSRPLFPIDDDPLSEDSYLGIGGDTLRKLLPR